MSTWFRCKELLSMPTSCNFIPGHSAYLDVRGFFLVIKHNHAISSSSQRVLVWQQQLPQSSTTSQAFPEHSIISVINRIPLDKQITNSRNTTFDLEQLTNMPTAMPLTLISTPNICLSWNMWLPCYQCQPSPFSISISLEFPLQLPMLGITGRSIR